MSSIPLHSSVEQFHIFTPLSPQSRNNQTRIVSSSSYHIYPGLLSVPTHLPSLLWPQKICHCTPPHASWIPRHLIFSRSLFLHYPLSLLYQEFLSSLAHSHYISPSQLLISFKLSSPLPFTAKEVIYTGYCHFFIVSPIHSSWVFIPIMLLQWFS